MNKRLVAAFTAFGTSVGLVALAQLPFWILQTRVAIQRPVINLDLLVAVLIMFRSRPLGLVALALGWLVEINLDASASYHFVGAADLVDAVRFMDLVKLNHILSWQLLLVLGVFVLCAAGLQRLVGQPPTSALLVVALGVLAFVLDGVNGSNYSLGLAKDRFKVDFNLAGSSSVVTFRVLGASWRGASEPMARMAEPVTYDRAVAWHDSHPQASILLVLVESMGLAQSTAVRGWLADRLDTPEIERRWTVQRTQEAFHGSTVYGELRVLCGLNGHYSRLREGDEARCLPRRFRAAGSQALGLHGFNMRMFDRQRWWRDLGLEPQDFDADSRTPGYVHCNDAFPGVCDGVVLQRATELADAPSRLVYAVTLDTHLPLPVSDLAMRRDLPPLCRKERLTLDACRMVNRLAWVLDQLQANLARMAHPPLVLISGDHAPPFLALETRAAFDAAHVQGFILEPR